MRGRGCSLPVGRPGCRRGSAAPGKAACWTASTGRGAQPARTLVTETPGAQEHQARVRDLEEAAEGLRRQLAEQRGQQASAAAGEVGGRATHAVRGCARALWVGRNGRVDDPRSLQPAPRSPRCDARFTLSCRSSETHRLLAFQWCVRVRGQARGHSVRRAPPRRRRRSGSSAWARPARRRAVCMVRPPSLRRGWRSAVQRRAPPRRAPPSCRCARPRPVPPWLSSAGGRPGASLCTSPPAECSAARGSRRSGLAGCWAACRHRASACDPACPTSQQLCWRALPA